MLSSPFCRHFNSISLGLISFGVNSKSPKKGAAKRIVLQINSYFCGNIFLSLRFREDKPPDLHELFLLQVSSL